MSLRRGSRALEEALYALYSSRAYVKAALLTRLQYTSAYLWDIASSLLAFATVFLVWGHVLRAEHASLAFAREQLFAYLALVYCLSFAMNMPLETLMGQRVRMGLVATDLLRPIDFQWMCFLMSLADVAAQTVLALFLLGAAWLALPLAPYTGALEQPTACIASLSLAVVIQYGIGFLFTTIAFVTHYSYGSYYLRQSLQVAFGGMTAPLALMRPSVGALAGALPFAHVLHTPALLLMGQARGSNAWHMVGAQACWALALVLLGRGMFAWFMRRLVIQGG